MPLPERIECTKVLLVEGRDEERLYTALVKDLALSDIQVICFGGVSRREPRRSIRGLKKLPGYHRVQSLGIIRDADDNPKGVLQSLGDALRAEDLAAPDKALTWCGSRPRVGLFIQPGGERNGALESLCLEAVADDPAQKCVDALFGCVQVQGLSIAPKSLCKARAQAFLATREQPGKRVGEAGAAGYWNWHSPVWDPVKTFLRRM